MGLLVGLGSRRLEGELRGGRGTDRRCSDRTGVRYSTRAASVKRHRREVFCEERRRRAWGGATCGAFSSSRLNREQALGDKRIAHGAAIDGRLRVMFQIALGRQVEIAARLRAALAKFPEERVTFMV